MGKGKKLTVRLWKRARDRLPGYLLAAPPRKGQEATPQYRMRLLLGELVEHGADLFTYRDLKDSEGRLLLDGTNNACERAIGWCGPSAGLRAVSLSNRKIRYRQMRGGQKQAKPEGFPLPKCLLVAPQVGRGRPLPVSSPCSLTGSPSWHPLLHREAPTDILNNHQKTLGLTTYQKRGTFLAMLDRGAGAIGLSRLESLWSSVGARLGLCRIGAVAQQVTPVSGGCIS